MTSDATLLDKNLEALAEDFLDGTQADKGLDLLLTTPEPKLAKLLRSHLVEGVGSGETAKRDSVDDFLAYTGILELAAMTGSIPWPPRPTLGKRFRRALSRPSVRRYYEFFYPLLLPTLFRWRLEGEPLDPYGSFESGIVYFQQFLALSDVLSQPDVEMFLWFLDDGKDWDDEADDWVGLSDFFEVLGKPATLIQHVSEQADTPLTRSVHGFGKFLVFADALDRSLASMTEHEHLRSALWHYHAYWFYQLSGQVGGVIAAGIEEFRRYVRDRPTGRISPKRRELIKQTHVAMDRSQLALRRLTSSAYRGPLEVAYFKRTL